MLPWKREDCEALSGLNQMKKQRPPEVSATPRFQQCLTLLRYNVPEALHQPVVDTDKWNLVLGPRLVASLSGGSVGRNELRFLQSAFFMISLGSIRGDYR